MELNLMASEIGCLTAKDGAQENKPARSCGRTVGLPSLQSVEKHRECSCRAVFEEFLEFACVV